ncbi:SusC/RagA family TonB-linked outer membrane protein [Bacteroides xylanisolvens]|uniref:SusC/RagA family TonB-linked outer membrane protein n=1 Tax=Bacteroides xylanisolvens TaxID=371601 RepID=UPI001C37ACA2|nr:SusC/RagA family TonB-linked outer membrane protein [Bacteroides xylanisolvens]MBV3831381.1 SusC/RagA family TonB-linked outer membrane protein [Bacteroides xylanisolvens]MBV3874426.1 SusC/RagA family TonB-linked outer membrane protein [Bacteroides xylanisolvens]MBV3879706.1 SusC/RagA family TonB-linked outer membrane protein [Bacteroides xylanisolvens]MBV3905650.1 SusC/RagA family TonB-linked outer membrane protein [Bacteroides xylanisolvens]MBV3911160.1 SusC/RagA family TonB-linked outer 
MRISLILLFAVVLQLSAENGYAQRTRIPISMNNASIEQVLNKIEEISDFVFLYNDKTIQTNRIVSVRNTNGKIMDILDEVFRGTNIVYTVVDKQIILSTNKLDVVAQNPSFPLKGVVKDVKGEPLIGVNVKVKGAGKGTITDFDGKFILQVVKGDILEISYVGYVSQSIKISDSKALDIVLTEDTKVLNEVVVTALGLKRETKSLTYNVQQVSSDEITKVKEVNMMNSLAGKVAGVSINSSSAGIGGGARVVMRGTKSISGNNNALYVVDGVPLPSSYGTQPGGRYEGAGQSGDGISYFNSDDIESISVLSGSAAAALYGSAAANGVVLITTKKGAAGKTSVSYNNNSTFYSPFVMPKFQNSYGSEPGEWFSWSSKLDTPSSYDVNDFFQTGYNVANTVSLTTGNDKNQTYVSVGTVNGRGIIHNNDLDRYNFSARNTASMLNDKLHLDVSFMYSNVKEQNMLAQGEYGNPLVPVYLFPRGEDIEKYRYYERYDIERNIDVQYWPLGENGLSMQNPYWVTDRNMYINKKDRFLTSASLKYEITNWLNVSARAKMDRDIVHNERKMYASTLTVLAENSDKGAYIETEQNVTQYYADVMANVNKYFADDKWNVTATLGASLLDLNSRTLTLGGGLLTVPNRFTVNNIDTSGKLTYRRGNYHDRTNSLFATASVGYKGMVYVDGALRSDWLSALAGTKHKSILYPSVGASAILTDAFNIKSDILSYAKIRLSYSEVGNAPSRFSAITTYSVYGGLTTTSYFPIKDLKPERTYSWETGLNLALFENKLTLDATVYRSYTKNQLFSPEISTTTGYSSIYVNAGKVTNEGIELALGYKQKIGQVDWKTTLLWSLNRNKVNQLLPEYTNDELGVTVRLDEMDVYSMGGAKKRLTVGGSMGDLYANILRTDEHGHIWLDSKSNTIQTEKNNYIYVGNTNPKYVLSWRNEFFWRGISLGFMINARVGGRGASATQAVLDYYGVSETSAKARDNGGVLVNGYKYDAQSWYQTVGGNGVDFVGSCYIYDMTNVRLGELSIGYDIPINKWCKFIKELNVSLVGRNLLMIYCKAPFDPETTAGTGTYNQGMDYFMQPSLRSMGFSAKVTF